MLLLAESGLAEPLVGPPTPEEVRAWTRGEDHPSQRQLEACADCHPELVEGFKKTFMSRALAYPSLDQVIEDFSGTRAEVRHPITGVGYRAYIDDEGRWWQEEYDLQGTYRRRVEVKYLIGSGSNTRSYIGEISGELYELPLTWYSATEDRAGLWDMSPGYQRADHFRFDRPVKADCLFCHNDLTPMVEGRLAAFKEELAPGITCVRCHGDGQAHIEAHLEGKVPRGADPTILNPKHLPLGRQQQICEQCHLSGISRALLPERRWDQYDPRTPLEDYVRIYAFTVQEGGEPSSPLAEHKSPTSFGIASHAERMRLSACAQGADLTCISCHDPHRPDTRESYQEACLTCHASTDHPEDTQAKAPRCGAEHQGRGQAGEPCYRCHMRSSGTSDIPHVKMTDHWVKRKLEPVGESGPDEPIKSDHLISLLPPLKEEFKKYEDGLLALAYGDLVIYGVHPELAPRALRSLSEAAQKHPTWSELWERLGEISLSLGDRIASLGAYARHSELDPLDEFHRLKEVSTLMVIGQIEQAELHLLSLIKHRPDNYLALEKLANLRLQQGRYVEASQLYIEADRYGPHAHSIPHNQGFLALLQGDLGSARRFFEEGLRRDALSREGPFFMGLIDAADGAHDLAVAHYREALKIDHRFFQVYEYLARSLLILKREEEAIDVMKTWISHEANAADPRLLLAQILDRKARYQEVYDLLKHAVDEVDDPRLPQALRVAEERLKLAPRAP